MTERQHRLLPTENAGHDASHAPHPNNPKDTKAATTAQDAPNGIAVKALRPLRGRAPPEP